MSVTARLTRSAVVMATAALALTGFAPTASAQEGFPGTIKVSAASDAPDPSNDPKPGCDARIDFFNFDPGTYQVTFFAMPPTGSGQVPGGGPVTITQEPSAGDDVQLSEVFELDLSGLDAATGVKLKVEVTDPERPGQGAKSKVFEFGCQPAGPGGGTNGAGQNRAAPSGGFETGGGGAVGGLPLLPVTALGAGLLLLGAGVVRRRSQTG